MVRGLARLSVVLMVASLPSCGQYRSGAGVSASETDGASETEGGGSCGNGVVDGDEVCDDGNDVDGDGCNRDCVVSGTELWCKTIAGTAGGLDEPAGVVAHGDGVVLAVNVREGAEPTDPARVVVRRYGSDGGEDWSLEFTRDGDSEMEADGLGGAADGTLFLLTTVADVQGFHPYVHEISADGVLTWEAAIPSETPAHARALVVDADTIFVTHGPYETSTGDAVLTALERDGTTKWQQVIDVDDLREFPFALHALEGAILVGGAFETQPSDDTEVPRTEAFVRSYDLSGEVAWTTRVPREGGGSAELRGLTALLDGTLVGIGTDGITSFAGRPSAVALGADGGVQLNSGLRADSSVYGRGGGVASDGDSADFFVALGSGSELEVNGFIARYAEVGADPIWGSGPTGSTHAVAVTQLANGNVVGTGLSRGDGDSGDLDAWICAYAE